MAPLPGWGEVGEGCAEGRHVGAAARPLADPQQGQHPERPQVEEEAAGEGRVEQPAADQHRLAPDAVDEMPRRELYQRAGHQRPGDEEGDVGGGAAMGADVEGHDREEGGDAGEHHQLAEQQPVGGFEAAHQERPEDFEHSRQ